MASRRMKMKVAVNVGRGGRPSLGEKNARPTTPVPGNRTDASSLTTGSEINLRSKSPQKNSSNQFTFPHSSSSTDPVLVSPTKRTPLSSAVSISQERTAKTRNVSEIEAEDESLVFDEDELAGIDLQPIWTKDGNRSPVTTGEGSCSPQKSASTSTVRDTERSPGIAPSLTSSTTSAILSNIQKEIGSVHVANVTSNETLGQRLRKGTSSTTTKYSILRKEFMAANSSKKVDKKDLTILHFTFWNPPEESKTKAAVKEDEDAVVGDVPTLQVDNEEEELELKKPGGPRVKVGPDGELIIDEQSLVVETSESVRAKKQLSQMETVNAPTCGFYRHKKTQRRGYDWSVKETVRFFKALTMCGTDFSMMAHLFPKRTRAELKAKFKREDRKNSILVSQALSTQSFDPMESLSESEDSEPDIVPPKRRRSSATDEGERRFPKACNVGMKRAKPIRKSKDKLGSPLGRPRGLVDLLKPSKPS